MVAGECAPPGFDYYVVFGAKVLPDGKPSGVLARRVRGAWAASRGSPARRFLVTGARGEHGPPEAIVMRDLLLELGAAPDSILLETTGHDTLSSVVACAALLAERSDVRRVLVCTSPYHQTRCRALLAVLGVRSESAPMPSDRPAAGLAVWLYYRMREAVATLWDVPLLAVERALGRRSKARRGDLG